MTTLDERVAVLEARMDQDADDRRERRADLDRKLQAIETAINDQTQEIARYKGVVGGIALALSMLWAGLGFFKDTIGRLFDGS